MIVKTVDLYKKYKEVTALNHFNIEVNKGEIFGLLGPNGSGKTTAIGCILSIIDFEKGDVEIFGEKMSPKRNDIKKKIGYIPQEVSVISELTVYENIDFFCGLYITDKEKRAQYVEEAIEFTGLGDIKKFYPKKLSGGLLRRLNIACGIVHKPQLIFFDEPTVAVDPQSRNSILAGIKKLADEGATIIYTSHYMEEVEILCDRIAIMDKGHVIAKGTKEELKRITTLTDKIVLSGVKIDKESLMDLKSMNDVNRIIYELSKLEIAITNKRAIAEVINYLDRNNIFYDSLNIVSPTLNDIFLEITGKELRDYV